MGHVGHRVGHLSRGLRDLLRDRREIMGGRGDALRGLRRDGNDA